MPPWALNNVAGKHSPHSIELIVKTNHCDLACIAKAKLHDTPYITEVHPPLHVQITEAFYLRAPKIPQTLWKIPKLSQMAFLTSLNIFQLKNQYFKLRKEKNKMFEILGS